ncbi:uncharacterized protein EURHEDRAFT_410428 [Aspergillus ruber CBS 135680]|uniref:Uncharacterized protein n=1 Tax=Aspergillus ruber (strain CBS 135680) TaxID=1388766 RepID=A0A017SK69_ASPRC|nr:uncharacterized protein EURHEDRAFT_410428 [Aspergillus ruber CBS 135680]EYE97363.1 hypothetical protein EURHEDRAFT_410428 [Aspergillus ruber CBS 135680]
MDASLTTLEYAGPISLPRGIQEYLAEHNYLSLSLTQQHNRCSLTLCLHFSRYFESQQRHSELLPLTCSLGYAVMKTLTHHCAGSVGYDWMFIYGISFARLLLVMIGYLVNARVSSASLRTLDSSRCLSNTQ